LAQAIWAQALAQIRCVFLGVLLDYPGQGPTHAIMPMQISVRLCSFLAVFFLQSGANAIVHQVIDQADTGVTMLRSAAPHELTGAAFGDRCNSKTKKFMYALRVAHRCSSDLASVWECIQNQTSPVLTCLSLPMAPDSACRTAIDAGCEELTPKCCRCKTHTEMSNNISGCLLQIYQGDPCGDDCRLLDYSDGRYPQSGWLWFGKDNYKFHGTCEEAKEEKDVFAPHVMCPEPV